MFHVKPEVLDEARKINGFSSDDKLASAMDMSGAAIRNLRHGRTSPLIGTLMKLRRLTGIPIEAMIIESAQKAAA